MVHYLLINHGNILTDPTRSVMFVLQNEEKKKRKACLSVSASLDMVIYKVQFVLNFFFFNDTNMSVVVGKKIMGEIHLFIKKKTKSYSQTQTSRVIFCLKESRERSDLTRLFFFSI